MANKFDTISATETTGFNNLNLLNETFHIFSKSPASPTTTLGGARLKSGHVTTASDVWSWEIPAFFKAVNEGKFNEFSTIAVKDDLCLYGGEVYQHNGTEFVSLGNEDDVLVDGKIFSKNGKNVIKYHKERTAINLTADNNNGDGSDGFAAKIYNAAEGSTAFVSQFISSTDKIVNGVPSLGYDAVVGAGGIILAEGLTNDNDYICNAYAGVIQFNKARSQGSVTVSAWEYIGEKLNEKISLIESDIEEIVNENFKDVSDELNDIHDDIEEINGKIEGIKTDYIKTVSVTDGTTSKGNTIKIKDSREEVFDADVWDFSVTMNNDNTIIINNELTDASEWSGKNEFNSVAEVKIYPHVWGSAGNNVLSSYSIGSKTLTKIANDAAYNGETKVANIKTSTIQNGKYMFKYTKLEDFYGDLRSLENGIGMFAEPYDPNKKYDTPSILNFKCKNDDLSSLKISNDMFYWSPIETFNADLSSLESGFRMFYSSGLKNFNSKLDKLKTCRRGFQDCKLEEFVIDMPKLKNGEYMFQSAVNLKSFVGDLSSLINGSVMFSGCSLSDCFISNLSSLVTGNNMFGRNAGSGTRLSKASIKNICNTLPNWKDNVPQTWDTVNGGYKDWVKGDKFIYLLKADDASVDEIKDIKYETVNTDDVKKICIFLEVSEKYDAFADMSEEDKNEIKEIFKRTSEEKGWIILTNTELGSQYGTP